MRLQLVYKKKSILRKCCSVQYQFVLWLIQKREAIMFISGTVKISYPSVLLAYYKYTFMRRYYHPACYVRPVCIFNITQCMTFFIFFMALIPFYFAFYMVIRTCHNTSNSFPFNGRYKVTCFHVISHGIYYGIHYHSP